MTAATLALPALLTYEAYMAGYFEGSYDIVEGVLIQMPGGTWKHQKTAFRIAKVFDLYQEESGTGEVLIAPYDVLIRRMPRLQTRQPDVLFVSHARLAQGGGIPEKGPLEVAPELIVEVISDSETKARFDAKIRDYIAVGVSEVWRVWQDTRTVEVLDLTSGAAVIAASYDETETVPSLTFPDLQVAVAAIFGA